MSLWSFFGWILLAAVTVAWVEITRRKKDIILTVLPENPDQMFAFFNFGCTAALFVGLYLKMVSMVHKQSQKISEAQSDIAKVQEMVGEIQAITAVPLQARYDLLTAQLDTTKAQLETTKVEHEATIKALRVEAEQQKAKAITEARKTMEDSHNAELKHAEANHRLTIADYEANKHLITTLELENEKANKQTQNLEHKNEGLQQKIQQLNEDFKSIVADEINKRRADFQREAAEGNFKAVREAKNNERARHRTELENKAVEHRERAKAELDQVKRKHKSEMAAAADSSRRQYQAEAIKYQRKVDSEAAEYKKKVDSEAIEYKKQVDSEVQEQKKAYANEQNVIHNNSQAAMAAQLKEEFEEKLAQNEKDFETKLANALAEQKDRMQIQIEEAKATAEAEKSNDDNHIHQQLQIDAEAKENERSKEHEARMAWLQKVFDEKSNELNKKSNEFDEKSNALNEQANAFDKKSDAWNERFNSLNETFHDEVAATAANKLEEMLGKGEIVAASEKEKLQNEIKSLQERLAAAETPLPGISDEEDSFIDSEPNITTDSQTLQKEVNRLRNNEQAYGNEIETLRKTAQAFQLEIEKSATNTQALQGEIETLKGNLGTQAAQTGDVTALQNEVNVLRENETSYGKEIESLRSTAEGFQGQIESLQTDDQALRAHIQTLENQLASNQNGQTADVDALKTEISTLQHTTTGYENELKTLKADHHNAQIEISNYQRNSQLARAEMLDVQRRAENAESETMTLKTVADQTQQFVQRLQRDYKNLQGLVQEKENQIVKNYNEIQHQTDAFKRLKSQLDTADDNKRSAVRAERKHIDRVNERNGELEEKIEALAKELKKSRAELQEARETIASRSASKHTVPCVTPRPSKQVVIAKPSPKTPTPSQDTEMQVDEPGPEKAREAGQTEMTDAPTEAKEVEDDTMAEADQNKGKSVSSEHDQTANESNFTNPTVSFAFGTSTTNPNPFTGVPLFSPFENTLQPTSTVPGPSTAAGSSSTAPKQASGPPLDPENEPTDRGEFPSTNVFDQQYSVNLQRLKKIAGEIKIDAEELEDAFWVHEADTFALVLQERGTEMDDNLIVIAELLRELKAEWALKKWLRLERHPNTWQHAIRRLYTICDHYAEEYLPNLQAVYDEAGVNEAFLMPRTKPIHGPRLINHAEDMKTKWGRIVIGDDQNLQFSAPLVGDPPSILKIRDSLRPCIQALGPTVDVNEKVGVCINKLYAITQSAKKPATFSWGSESLRVGSLVWTMIWVSQLVNSEMLPKDWRGQVETINKWLIKHSESSKTEMDKRSIKPVRGRLSRSE